MSSSSRIPGLVWSHPTAHGTLRILRVSSRTPTGNDHFVLTLAHVPVAPPFHRLTNALVYVNREWAMVKSVLNPVN